MVGISDAIYNLIGSAKLFLPIDWILHGSNHEEVVEVLEQVKSNQPCLPINHPTFIIKTSIPIDTTFKL